MDERKIFVGWVGDGVGEIMGLKVSFKFVWLSYLVFK